MFAAKNRTALVEELADVFEVIDSLCAVNGISKDEILAAQSKKREERGGFDGRKFVNLLNTKLAQKKRAIV